MVADDDGGGELRLLDKQLLRRRFNPDPRVADYESGEVLFAAWVGGTMASAYMKHKTEETQ